MPVSRKSKARAIIADLPAGVTVAKWNKNGTEYIRVRLGKKFTGGKRHSVCFRTEKEAREYLKGDATRLKAPTLGLFDLKQQVGDAAFLLSRAEITESAAALKLCREKGFTLSDVVDFGLRHMQPAGGTKTFSEAASALLAQKKLAERSDAHREGMRSIFDLFAEEYGRKQVNLITRAMIEDWLGDQDDVSHGRRVAYARNLHIVFNYAVAQEWAKKNPCRTLERTSTSTGEVEFLRVPQLAKLLKFAIKEQPESVAGIAIKAFAGIRTGELVQLTWDRVGSRIIEIGGKKSESRRSRPVSLSENLIAWLEKIRKPSGQVAGTDSAFTWCARMARLAASADIALPYNCLRHGYGAFHYHQHKNENLTAAEMGNSPKIIRGWYVAPIVEEEEAVDFWAMTQDWIEEKPDEYFLSQKSSMVGAVGTSG